MNERRVQEVNKLVLVTVCMCVSGIDVRTWMKGKKGVQYISVCEDIYGTYILYRLRA